MKKSRKLFKILNIFIVFLFSWVLINSLWLPSNVYYSQNSFISLIISFVILVIWFVLYRLLFKLKNITIKKEVIILLIYFGIILAIQFIIIKELRVNPGWDFGVIFSNAESYALHGDRTVSGVYLNYFQLFPNNIILFIMLTIAIKLGFMVGLSSITSAILLNVFFIDLAILLLYIVIRKKSRENAIFMLILTLFFPALFLYTPIFYSDTLSLFIPSLFLLLFSFIMEDKMQNTKLDCMIWILIGITCFLAKELKITSLIIFLALCIKYCFCHKLKVSMKKIGIVLVTFVVFEFLFTSLIVNNESFHFKINNYGSIPYTHWLMMGVEDKNKDNLERNSIGGWNAEDYEYTQSFKTGKEAFKPCLDEYFRRVSLYGIVGYPKYLTAKAVNTWADGLYFVDTKLNINPVDSNTFLRKELLNNPTNKEYIVYFTQGVQFAFLFCLIFMGIKNFKSKNGFINEKTLACLGIAIFFLFWENRSRYLYNYILIFILIIVDFISSTNWDFLKKIINHRNKIHREFK